MRDKPVKITVRVCEDYVVRDPVEIEKIYRECAAIIRRSYIRQAREKREKEGMA